MVTEYFLQVLLLIIYLFLILINDCLGGSMSNMYGLVIARFNKYPEVKTKGVARLGSLVAFTSEEVLKNMLTVPLTVL